MAEYTHYEYNFKKINNIRKLNKHYEYKALISLLKCRRN